jgi:hypothetical protein
MGGEGGGGGVSGFGVGEEGRMGGGGGDLGVRGLGMGRWLGGERGGGGEQLIKYNNYIYIYIYSYRIVVGKNYRFASRVTIKSLFTH